MPKKPYSIFGPREGEPGRSSLVTSAKASLSSSGSVYPPPEQRRAPLPSQDDKPVYGIKTSKNFITANAVEAILQGFILVLFIFVIMNID